MIVNCVTCNNYQVPGVSFWVTSTVHQLPKKTKRNQAVSYHLLVWIKWWNVVLWTEIFKLICTICYTANRVQFHEGGLAVEVHVCVFFLWHQKCFSFLRVFVYSQIRSSQIVILFFAIWKFMFQEFLLSRILHCFLCIVACPLSITDGNKLHVRSQIKIGSKKIFPNPSLHNTHMPICTLK